MAQARSRYALFAFALFVASTPALAEQALLETTGPFIPVAGEYEHVYGIIDRGDVVGEFRIDEIFTGLTAPQAWQWTSYNSHRELGWLPGGDDVSRALAISKDGLTTVGYSFDDGVPRAFRRAIVGGQPTTFAAIGAPSFESSAAGVSDDGFVVVGYTKEWGGRDRAFRFQVGGSLQDLGSLAGAEGTSRAHGISGDGATIVGETQVPGGAAHAFLWTSAGMVDLGTIGGAAGESRALGVSTDGRFVVGESATPEGFTSAFLVTEGGTMVALPTIGDFEGDSVALTVSADGKTVAGTSASAEFPEGEACVWFDGVPVAMRVMMSERFGYNVASFLHFKDARCSPDGLKFAGNTIYRQHRSSPPPAPPAPTESAYRVTIAPDLQPPRIESAIPSGSTVTVRGGQTFRATVTASDPDGGWIHFQSHGGPSDKILTPPLGAKVENGGELAVEIEWTPALSMFSRTTTFTLGFADEFRTHHEWVCTVVVPANASPEVGPIEPIVAECENGVHSATLSATPVDPENVPMLVKWVVDGQEIVVKENVPSGETQTFEHDYSHGVHDVEFRAWDGKTAPTIVRTTVTVQDTTAPILIVAPDVVVGTDAGEDFATNVMLDQPTAYDESGHEVTVTSEPLDVYFLGTNEVVWTAEDEDGNVATAVQKVIVEDREAPTLVGSASVQLFVDSGKLFSTAALPQPEATDNVDDASAIEIVSDAPVRFPLGTTQVTFTAIDGGGNSATWPMDVTVVNRRPQANAGANVVVTTTSERGLRVSLDGSASSDPDAHRLKLAWTAPGVKFAGAKSATPSGLFPVGATFATLTATDPAGAADGDRVRIVVRLKNAKPRASGAAANASFGRAVAQAKQAASGRSGASSLSGLSYASAAAAYGDAAGEFVRWEEGQSEDDALLAYSEVRLLQQAYGAAATNALLSAYAETGDDSLLSAALSAASGSAYAAADLFER